MGRRKKRPDLRKLLVHYLDRVYKEDLALMKSYSGGQCGRRWWEDLDYDEELPFRPFNDDEQVFPPIMGPDDYDVGSPDDDDIDYSGSDNSLYKRITFYNDYSERKGVEEFDNLKDFLDFCDLNGYIINEFELEDLRYRSVSHCCLSADSRHKGRNEIVSFDSYNQMYFDQVGETESVYD